MSAVGERIRIEGVAASGAGVGRLADGRAIFVHRSAPGEIVEATIREEKKRWARGELLRVIEPSPQRRTAPCPHYDRCGGCTLEHLEYGAQLRAKHAIVAETLRRIGGIGIDDGGLHLPPVVPSPSEFQYRNRVSFTLLRLGGDRVVVGFHEIERPGRIVDITGECLLPEPAIATAWDRIRAEWGRGAHRLPSGRRLRLTLRATLMGEVALTIEGGYGPGRPAELLERVPELTAVWHRPGSKRADRPPHLLAGKETITERWGAEEIGVRGTAFLQVNRGAAELLEAHLLELIGDPAGLRIVDAYAGIGLRVRHLARKGAEVVGIELDPTATEIAREGAPPNAEFVEGRVEEHLADHLQADLVVLNPPRTGLDEVVPELLRGAPPRRLIYVSCDPATLARDLRRLGDRFRIGSMMSFDLFPQTAHLETVVELICDTT